MLVGLKLAPNCVQHERIFHIFPIWSQRYFSCHTKRFGVLRPSATSDAFAVLLVVELHRLEVMLNGPPPPIIKFDSVRSKIRELGISICLRVEVDGVLRVEIHGKMTDETKENCK